METTATNLPIHRFEAAGLGKAPFRFLGAEERRGPIKFLDESGVMLEVGAPGQPMGTCDYCGQGIAICCKIRSADGREFIVGTDCVRKTGDAGMLRGVKSAEGQRRKERAAIVKAATAERVRACRRLFERDDVRAQLATMTARTAGGKDMPALRYVEFCLYGTGAGAVRAAELVEQAADAAGVQR